MAYSEGQEKVLALVPKFTAGLGIASLLFVLNEIRLDHKKKQGNAIIRAIAGISFFELLDAIGWFLSTWAVPAGSFAFAAGNQASCSFQGLCLQVVIGAPLYNAALAFYFFLVVHKHKISDDLESIEKVFHYLIFVYAVGTSIAFLFLEQYNHVGAVCWVNGSPAGCGSSTYQGDSDVPCDRGENAWLYGMALFYIPLWTCIVVVISLNTVNYLSMKDKEMAHWFAVQSILYALAFCVTWAPSTTWSALHWKNGGGFWLDLASGFFEPLAGFWNLLIFLRNRPRSRKKIVTFLLCGLGMDSNKVFNPDGTSDEGDTDAKSRARNSDSSA